MTIIESRLLFGHPVLTAKVTQFTQWSYGTDKEATKGIMWCDSNFVIFPLF